MTNELYHHGVKGMKWGVRHDPELVGRKQRVKAKDLPFNQKSNHRRELELRYRNSGMDRKEAIERADKRIRVEKILAATAAVTAAAAVTAVAVNNYKERGSVVVKKGSDIYLKEGTKFQRMAIGDGSGEKLNEYEWYATFTKKDNARYGRYAYQLSRGKGANWGGGADYASKLAITKDGPTRIAGEKTSFKAFSKLWKEDPEFRDDLAKSIPKGRANFASSKADDVRKGYLAIFNNRNNPDIEGKDLSSAYQSFRHSKVFDGTSKTDFASKWKNDSSFRDTLLKSVDKGTRSKGFNDRQAKRAMTVYLNRHNPNPSNRDLYRMYEAWNINAVADHGEHGSRAMAKMRSTLKGWGYHGTIDVNDKKFSGYHAQSPVIMFADKYANYSIKSTRISKSTARGMNFVGSSIIGMDNAFSTDTFRRTKAATGTVAAVGTTAVVATRQRILRQYKKEHPNTRLTNSQIIKSYNKSRKKNGR